MNIQQTIRSIAEEVFVEGKKVIRSHTAWQLGNGGILLYEYMSCNYPSYSVCFFDNLDDYLETCQEVSWLKIGPFERS